MQKVWCHHRHRYRLPQLHTEVLRWLLSTKTFPLVMTIVAGHAGSPLPPTAYLAQAAFVSLSLSDIWQCVEASWQQPLKTRALVTGLMDFPRVHGCTEAFYPGVPPWTRPWLPTCHLLGQQAGSLISMWQGNTGIFCQANYLGRVGCLSGCTTAMLHGV